MLQRCSWTSQRNHLIGFLLSKRVWEVSTHLLNTTTYVITNRSETLLTYLLQQSRDVKDKLEQFIPWLTKLLESLAKVDPNGDQQEVERRSQMARLVSSRPSRYERPILCRSLEDITQRSQALLAKGKCIRFLDKAQDVQEVGRLIEQLQRTILIYQVGTKGCRDQAG